MLFLPGWGFDARLVDLYRLFPERCLILPDSFVNPTYFADDLSTFLQSRHISEITIVGWSMGAQLGLDFCLNHTSLVQSLTLVAMRRQWPQQAIAAIRTAIAVDLPGYMRDFYRKCFLGYKRAYQAFVSSLQEDYLRRLDKEILLAGLDYLQNFSLPGHLPSDVTVHIIHGRRDVVAPVEEMPQFDGVIRKVLPNAGHMVLLDQHEAHNNG